jgi:hypothetical protein
MYEEQNKAADKYDFYLILNLGGEIACDCHFNVESDGEDDPNWNVSEYELFFLGTNVTKMVAAEQVEELIYEQATDVNDQIREQMED